MKQSGKLFGTVGAWGQVGYVGDVFAPSSKTYAGVDPKSVNYTHRADSGDFPAPIAGGSLTHVLPLILGALWEAAFAIEAGPLSTWGN
jgi:hypothetical protein